MITAISSLNNNNRKLNVKNQSKPVSFAGGKNIPTSGDKVMTLIKGLSFDSKKSASTIKNTTRVENEAPKTKFEAVKHFLKKAVLLIDKIVD